MTHELKLCKRFYETVASGAKTYEVRKNDRGFKVGDTLRLIPVTDDEKRTYVTSLQPLLAEVSYMLAEPGWGIENGYCVMALKNVRVDYSTKLKVRLMVDLTRYNSKFVKGAIGESDMRASPGRDPSTNHFLFVNLTIGGTTLPVNRNQVEIITE